MMQTFYELQPCPVDTPIALTVGFFDGVHLGHQTLIDRLHELAPTAACVTFNNHPSTLFTPKEPQHLITTTKQRVRLLEKAGVDLLYLLTFTKEFAEQSAQTFLLELRQEIPFTHLVLGHDAHIGHKREGTPQRLAKIAQEEGFELEYIDPVLLDGEPVSSSACRSAIKKGELDRAEFLLGRKLSYTGTVVEGPHKGREVGFPTANIPLEGLILPPLGVYAVTVNSMKGVANIGHAPTLHENRVSMLEVYLFDFNEDLYGQEVEVTLQAFLRPEKKFASVEALRHQIAEDVARAKEI